MEAPVGEGSTDVKDDDLSISGAPDSWRPNAALFPIAPFLLPDNLVFFMK